MVAGRAQLALVGGPGGAQAQSRMLPELVSPVALGVAARIPDLAAVSHQEDQEPTFGRGRKREGHRVALAPLDVGRCLLGARERVIHVTEDQAPAVAGDAIGHPRSDQRGDRRAAAVGADHDLAGDLVLLAVAVVVSHPADPTAAPEQAIHRATLAHHGPLFGNAGPELDVEQVARHTHAEVDAAVRTHALATDDTVDLDAHMAHA